MKISIKKLTAGTALVFLAGTAFTTYSQANAKQLPVAQAAVTEATTTIAVEKMTCATCPISVRKAMKRVDGVKSVQVNFKTKISTVVYDPTLTTPAQIAAASTNVGYPASEVAS